MSRSNITFDTSFVVNDYLSNFLDKCRKLDVSHLQHCGALVSTYIHHCSVFVLAYGNESSFPSIESDFFRNFWTNLDPESRDTTFAHGADCANTDSDSNSTILEINLLFIGVWTMWRGQAICTRLFHEQILDRGAGIDNITRDSLVKESRELYILRNAHFCNSQFHEATLRNSLLCIHETTQSFAREIKNHHMNQRQVLREEKVTHHKHKALMNNCCS